MASVKPRIKPLRGSAILDRYTLLEFLAPFVFCVIGFTVILLSGILFELVDLIFAKDVAVSRVFRMLLYQIPGMVVLVIPIAALFSTLLAFGRLNQDSELKVMVTSGVPYRRILLPVIIAGMVISGLTFTINEYVVPWSNHEFQKVLREIMFQDGIPLVEENVFFNGGEDRYFYINEVDSKNNRLKDVMIYELNETTFPQLITAKNGTYTGNNWFLSDGVVQNLDAAGYVTYQTKFEAMHIVTPDEADLYFGNQKTADEMSRRELKTHIDRFQRSGINVISFVVDYHLKLALPIASFMFILFGAPLSLYSKSGISFGIATSLIVTVLFYVFTSVSRSLGVNGMIPPLLSAWMTNIFFAVIGFILLTRADRLH